MGQLIVAYGIVCCTGVCRCPCRLLQAAGQHGQLIVAYGIVCCTGVCRCPCRLLQAAGQHGAAHCSIWYCVLYWVCRCPPADFYKLLANMGQLIVAYGIVCCIGYVGVLLQTSTSCWTASSRRPVSTTPQTRAQVSTAKEDVTVFLSVKLGLRSSLCN